MFFFFFHPPSVGGRGEATGGETMWRLCSALALLALCLGPCDSQTSERGGFPLHFPPKLNLSLGKKDKRPSAVKTNHMGLLFHLIRPRRIFPLLALLLVSGHILPGSMHKNKSIFSGNHFTAGLAGNFNQHCHFPTLPLSCISGTEMEVELPCEPSRYNQP